MKSSFMKSLPSHRKKERERKSRHHQRSRERRQHHHSNAAGSTDRYPLPLEDDDDAADGNVRRSVVGESSSPRGVSSASPQSPSQFQSQAETPGSIVEATEVQFPPQALSSTARRFTRRRRPMTNAEEGGAGDENDASAVDRRSEALFEEEEMSQQSQGSIVEATEVQFPPPRTRTMATAGKSRGSSGAARKVSLDPRGGNRLASTDLPASPVQKEAADRSRSRERADGPLPDFRASPVHSSSAMTTSRAAFDEAYDEETVGMMDSPLSDRKENENNDSDGMTDFEEAMKPPHRRRDESVAQHKTDKPQASSISQRNHSDKRNLSMETEPRSNTGRKDAHASERNLSLDTEPTSNSGQKVGEMGDTPSSRRSRNPYRKETNVSARRNLSVETERRRNDTGGDSGQDVVADRNHLSLETAPGTNSRQKVAGEESGKSNHAKSVHDEEVVDGNMELLLTSSDIRGCIKATIIAKEMMEADLSQDPFDGIDIDQWKSIFEEFVTYLSVQGDPTSTEAVELQQISSSNKVYSIFDKGMNVNHCNAVFIYNMIRTIGDGMASYVESHTHLGLSHRLHDGAYGGRQKLDHLANCLDITFGVSEDSDPISVSVLKADTETVLKLSKSLRLSHHNEDNASAIIQHPSVSALPPHLQAMSQVFTQFTAKKTRPLQSQLKSTQKTLAVTRAGAMNLQKQALKLQDDLQDAQAEAEESKLRQDRAEAKVERQKYEFEKREESFERVKEHYKSEIDKKELEMANIRERFERELKEANAELARVTPRHSEQRRSAEQRKRKESSSRGDDLNQRSERRRHSMHPNANVHAEAAIDDHISPSIPRNIQCNADSIDGDLEGSRKRSKTSDRKSRHSTGTLASRQSRSAPYELQPPQKPRAASEPKKRDPHHYSKLMKDEQIKESGRLGQGDAKRNPLKSLAENNLTDHSPDISNLHDKKEPRNRREKSAMADRQQPRYTMMDQQLFCQPTSDLASSSKKQKASKNPKNPYLKQSYSTKNNTNNTDSKGEQTFAFQEVVRKRADREALPGHDCEECRKFYDALGKGYDTSKIVMECSRHRARHAPPSTPPDFWKLTFVDSVGSDKSTDGL